MKIGQDSARFQDVVLAGPVVGKAQADSADPSDGRGVHMFQDHSTAGLVALKRGPKCVCDVPGGIDRHGLTLCRSMELGCQWRAVVYSGSVGPNWFGGPCVYPGHRLLAFIAHVREMHCRTNAFIHGVVVRRRDVAVRGWRTWLLEDPLAHSYMWLRSDRIPPAP